MILRSLMYDEQYLRRVMPFLQPEYFHDKTEHLIFNKIHEFVGKYNVPPTKETLVIDVAESQIEQEDLDDAVQYLNALESYKGEKPNEDWLTDTTETWCKERAIYNAVHEAILVLDGKSKKTKGQLPKLLQDALAVSFDPHVGHDYFENAEERYEYYTRVDSKIPFHLKYFNKVTKNGIPNKTLNIILAGTNVGKSLFMCDLACNYLQKGKNVLYITMEMAEERIAERIDANLMDVPIDQLPRAGGAMMPKEAYKRRMESIHARTQGRLIVKEYPTAGAHVDHFRHLLQELYLKKKFKPHVIFIDYLNICGSSRMRPSAGSYEFVKSIAEELRGLAVEFDVPIWSATQMNRSGFNSTDPDLTNTSESFGLPATADFMFALVSSDELRQMNQLMCKVLKNRYGDVTIRNEQTGQLMSKFVIGVDRSKQKLYDLDDSAQAELNQDDDAPPDWNASSGKPNTPRSPKTPPSQAEVFAIDEQPEDRPFNGAEEDAERRRSATKSDTRSFRPHMTMLSGRGNNKDLYLG